MMRFSLVGEEERRAAIGPTEELPVRNEEGLRSISRV